MSDFTVIDKKDGKWYINTSEHRIPDYERQAENPGEKLVILEPGVPTKLIASKFLLGQPTVKACKDPMSDDDEPEAEVPAKAPAAKK